MPSSNDPGRFLLDTHAALWALREPERLSRQARAAIAKGRNVLSVVTLWEVTIKIMSGRLDVTEPETWWADALTQLAAMPLLLRPEHVVALAGLPPNHKDPFDRILIAQAAAEGLTLVTADANIHRYRARGIKVLG